MRHRGHEGTNAPTAASPDGKRVVSPTLVGRAEELERLTAAASCPPAVVVVDGEAGIGKTRLVSELVTRAEVGNRMVLTGRCHRIRESFPLGPVVDALGGIADVLPADLSPVTGALRPLLPELAERLPAAPAPLDDRGGERHRVFRGLVALLGALGPTVLVLEDMHWADEQTVDFVRYLLAEPPAELALVMTFRGEEVRPEVRALTAALPPGTTRADVVLHALDDKQTGALAAAIMGLDRVSDEFAAYLCERTSGLPFAIEELLALLRARGTLVRRRGGWARRALDELDVPSGIRDSILERVSRLSGEAREMVEAAAVLQVPVSAAVLTETAGRAELPAARALEEALESGVLAEHETGLGFRHLLAAQAVYEDMARPRRRELHARVATALQTRSPVPLGQVAHHLRFADRWDEWGVAAELAADHAIALGNDAEAVRLLEAVLRDAPLEPARAGAIAVKLVPAAIESLRARDVADLVATVLERDLPRDIRGELRFQLALLLHEIGDDIARARDLLTEAIADLEANPGLKAWAMVVLVIPVAPEITPAERKLWLGRALAVIPDIDDLPFRAFLLGKIAMVLAPIGDPAWRELLQRIDDQTGGVPRHRQEANAFWSIGTEVCYAGHHDVADRLLDAGLLAVADSESARLEFSLRCARVLLDYCCGQWEGLSEDIDAVTDEFAGHPRSSIDVDVVTASLALARGELDEAREQLSSVVDVVEQLGGYDLLPLPAAASIRLSLAQRDVDDALAVAERLFAAVESTGVWPPAARAVPAMTEALVTAGRIDRARALVDRFTAELRDIDAPLGPAVLPHAEGLLDAANGRYRSAVERLTTAARRYTELRCPYESAQAVERAADAAAAAGDDPGELVRTALSGYRNLGASWDAARAADTARRLGVTVPAHRRGGRQSYGDQLSPREREVAELAAAGRTNKEIAAELYLSVNTVARHITAAMRKLGVTSRVAIVHHLSDDDPSK